MHAQDMIWRPSIPRPDYRSVFIEPWSPYLGAVLLVLIVAGAMADGLFWGVFGGLRLWGDWFNRLIGLGDALGLPATLESPLLHRVSLMDIALLLGALCAALLSGQFVINRPPPLEYLWGALGGALMGVGATLAGGCTVGGFFVPLLHSSPAGMAMWLGLLAGAAAGLKLLLWTLDHVSWGTQAPPLPRISPALLRAGPWLGLAVAVAVLAWVAHWHASPEARLASRVPAILAGFAIGFVMHRSRFCVARAIREPFVTGEGEMSRAVMLALAIGIPLASFVFRAELLDPYVGIPPRFWLGSLLGGAAFGCGMVFAGGCGTGALWRAGEGHLKLWVALLFFAWSGSTASALMNRAGWTGSALNLDLIEESALGVQTYFPALFGGWGWTYLAAAAFLALWYALVRYNEASGRFTLG